MYLLFRVAWELCELTIKLLVVLVVMLVKVAAWVVAGIVALSAVAIADVRQRRQIKKESSNAELR